MIRESKSTVLIAHGTSISSSATNSTEINLGNAFHAGHGSTAYIPESTHPFEWKRLRLQLAVDSITTAKEIYVSVKTRTTAEKAASTSAHEVAKYTIPLKNVKLGTVLDEIIPNLVENNISVTVTTDTNGAMKAGVELFANV